MKVDEITLNNAMRVNAGTGIFLSFYNLQSFKGAQKPEELGCSFPSLVGGSTRALNSLVSLVLSRLFTFTPRKEASALHKFPK